MKLLLLALTLSATLAAACPPAEPLIDVAMKLNDQCRGGPGDDPQTHKACDARDLAFKRLKQKGWCYGQDAETMAGAKWARCHK